MSTQTKPIPKHQLDRLRLYPCDEVARYSVGGNNVTYSQAYEAICTAENCGLSEAGGRIFTSGAARRITELNKRYLAIARDFVSIAMKFQNIAMEQALKEIEAATAAQTAVPAESPVSETPVAAAEEVAP
jgi:hypothetical protein